jgi:formylaminopyrimidine deformylase / aminopyrimidine aminohydrolase
MGFCKEQLNRLEPLWSVMLHHRFLLETRDGKIPDETFGRWMQQDYLFVRAAIPFIAAIIPKAPPKHWEAHSNVIAMLQKELKLFEERANAVGVSFEDISPWFTNHAYIQFLLATAAHEPYPVAYTVLYAAEKAYHDSWKVVQKGLDKDSKWYPFVENWAGDAFAEYVDYLKNELNELAANAGKNDLIRMAEYFELTTRYEIAFWDMVYEGREWPGT